MILLSNMTWLHDLTEIWAFKVGAQNVKIGSVIPYFHVLGPTLGAQISVRSEIQVIFDSKIII